MDILPQPIKFDWDKGNLNKSLKKHFITNEEAEEAFLHPPIILLDDPNHSQTEKRYLALGKTDAGKLLSVIFTLRRRQIRIISARPMSRQERKLYETHS